MNWTVWVLLIFVSRVDLHRIYRGLHSGWLSAEEVHETVPSKVSPRGDFLSHDLQTTIGDEIHLNLSVAQNQHRLLRLRKNPHFLAPNLVVERRKRAIFTRATPKFPHCHFHGTIDGQDNSRVAVSTCNGLTGLLHTEQGRFYIEPVHKDGKISPGHPHLVYKRSAVNGGKKKRKKKRRKHSSRDCGTREPKKATEVEWQRQMGKLRVQERRHLHHNVSSKKSRIEIPGVSESDMKKHKYKKLETREKRSVSKPQYVETLLVADHSMVEFHNRNVGDAETYLLTIMNMVSTLYKDPSIGNSISVVIVKILLLEDPTLEPDLNNTVNADQMLRNFCKWQRNLYNEEDGKHDVAILVTRKDICARDNAPCNTLGVAHVGGMCKTARSCSVNEDNGITLAHTVAHEMGHNFGMHHDTEKIGCKGRQGNTSHVMTPSFEADTVGVVWSPCSRRDITNFLDKGLGGCLQNMPEQNDYEYPVLPPGAMYNADFQCRLQFGDESAVVCSPLDEICYRLWCTVNDTCTTQLRPAAPGTHCGKHKWCQEQRCVPMMELPTAIDGGWGEWSSWSECSRTCGAGVSQTKRECDHPKPTAGGKFCTGERRRYRICNTDPCPVNAAATFRASQCTAFDNRTHLGNKYKWQPYFDQEEPCQLYCSDANESVIVPWGEHAADGTPCNVGSRDVCISGICRRVGCDWVVDSKAHEDDCGICQGDGTKCDKFDGIYNKQSQSPGYREVAVIQAGARNIRIQEKRPSLNYISIGSATSKKFYLNGKRHITLPGEYTVAGAQALYERDEEQLEKIRIPGPIRERIVVYVIFRGKTPNPGVEYKYSLWKRESTQQLKYTWIMGDWSQCSATCGGGTQEKQPICQESSFGAIAAVIDETRIVDETMCDESSNKPDKLVRSCNDDPCASHWWVGPWQNCPITCLDQEEHPLQRRSVMCVDGQEMALPDKYCDRKQKPNEYTPCGNLAKCPQD